MNVRTVHRYRIGFVATAAILTIWGLIGLSSDEAGYTGALYEPDYVIRHVPPGSPLDEAGFQTRDRVASVEGIPIDELGMYSRWPLSLSRGPGESIQMEVFRGSERLAGEIVFREQPPSVSGMRLGAVVIALSFLWFGFWALLTAPTTHALRLAGIGLVAGLTLPGLNLGTWNGVRDHIQLSAMVLWALLLLRFFVLFPGPKLKGKGHMVTALPYLAWIALMVCLGLELIFHPRFYHSFGAFGNLLMLAYGTFALLALLHTWVTLPYRQRRDSGMGIILWGFLLVAVPNVARVLAWFIPPEGFDIPGSDYFPLLFIFFPAALAIGVRREAEVLDPPWGEAEPPPGMDY